MTYGSIRPRRPRHGSPSTPRPGRNPVRHVIPFQLGGGLPGFEERPDRPAAADSTASRRASGPDVVARPAPAEPTQASRGAHHPQENSRGSSRWAVRQPPDRLRADLLGFTGNYHRGSSALGQGRQRVRRRARRTTERLDQVLAGVLIAHQLAAQEPLPARHRRDRRQRADLHDFAASADAYQRQPDRQPHHHLEHHEHSYRVGGQQEDRNAVRNCPKPCTDPGASRCARPPSRQAREHRPHRLGGGPTTPPRRPRHGSADPRPLRAGSSDRDGWFASPRHPRPAAAGA